jgi:hypothetical protein
MMGPPSKQFDGTDGTDAGTATRKDHVMTPNATVSYMANQAERRLVEMKVERAWMVDEAMTDHVSGSGLLTASKRLIALVVTRGHRLKGTARTTKVLSPSLVGAVDPAR